MNTPVLEVHVPDMGWAEGTTPEEAMLAARTLCRDAWRERSVQGYDPVVHFYVAGKHVRTTTRRGLSR